MLDIWERVRGFASCEGAWATADMLFRPGSPAGKCFFLGDEGAAGAGLLCGAFSWSDNARLKGECAVDNSGGSQGSIGGSGICWAVGFRWEGSHLGKSLFAGGFRSLSADLFAGEFGRVVDTRDLGWVAEVVTTEAWDISTAEEVVETGIFSEAPSTCLIFLVEDGCRCEIMGGAPEVLDVVLKGNSAETATPRTFEPVGLPVSR